MDAVQETARLLTAADRRTRSRHELNLAPAHLRRCRGGWIHCKLICASSRLPLPNADSFMVLYDPATVPCDMQQQPLHACRLLMRLAASIRVTRIFTAGTESASPAARQFAVSNGWLAATGNPQRAAVQ